jgi:hypothetical protein
MVGNIAARFRLSRATESAFDLPASAEYGIDSRLCPHTHQDDSRLRQELVTRMDYETS